MTTKKNAGGQPPQQQKLLRRHRYNLLLNDSEAKAMDAHITDVGGQENRILSGAEIVRRQMMPLIHASAERHGIKLGST